MDCFMGLVGGLIVVVIVLIRLLVNQDRRVFNLLLEKANLERRVQELQRLQTLPDVDKDIIFDAQGGYKVVERKNGTKTM